MCRIYRVFRVNDVVKCVARYCYRARWAVVLVWVVVLAALATLSAILAGPTSDAYTVPDAPSQQAQELLQKHGLSGDASDVVRVVVQDDQGIGHSRAVFDSIAQDVRAAYPGADVRSPFSEQGRAQISADRTVAFAEIQFARDIDAQMVDELQSMVPDGADVAFSGAGFETQEDSGPGQGVGMLAAIVILLVAFGSVWAMGLPILVAVFGAGCGVTTIMLTANAIDLPSAAVPLAAMLAVGVGIDYSLLVVTRYREGLQENREPREAVMNAFDTAGRSVLFAGVTVVIALLGLLVVNMPLVNGVAIGAAVAVAITMGASLTLLPALLALIGTRIDRFGLPHRHSRSTGAPWARNWSRAVQRYRWPFAVVSALVLLALTMPAFDMRLGFANAGSLPADNTARQAHDMLADGFGPGINGPLFIAVDTGGESTGELQPALGRIAATAEGAENVASVSPPITSDDGQAGMLIVRPEEGPHAESTAQLVDALRGTRLPSALNYTPVSAEVTGQTAAAVDFADYTGVRLPWFIAVVLALAFALLMLVFRSVLVPLKAVIMNLLSIGAAFGVVVAAVQWGWGTGLFGIDEGLPVIAWVPMMLVAVVFGLSMDYEVFLLTRIKENYDAGQPNATAVASGLASTARVITAAAAIMVCVFGSFLLGAAIDLAVFGFGLAIAVLIDATLIRLVLVPATMEILGDANWWFPKKLPRAAASSAGGPA